MYNTVIFDLDGTLLYTLEDLTDSVNYAMNVMGYPERSIEEVRKFVGNGVRRLMELACPSDIDEGEFDRAFEHFKKYYDEHSRDKTKPYDGVHDLMLELKKNNIKMAIVSNKIDSAVKKLREEFFADVVDIAIGDCEGMRRKPYPDSCNKAIELLGSIKEETVYIGDSEVDIKTANNAGIDSILVLWGFRDKEFLIENGGKVFAEDTDDVLNIVLNKKKKKS